MKSVLLASVVAIFAGAGIAQAHDSITQIEQYAGQNAVIDISVNHGCEGSPVIGVKVKIPEGVNDVHLANTTSKVEIKKRKLAKPVPAEGGRTLTETEDEITWMLPKPMPTMGSFEYFRIRARMPDEPGKVLYFPTITLCEKGTDPYIDAPKTELRADQPDFGKKMGEFRRSTKGPAPFVILVKATKPERPWGN
jgi:uncharacterized protein YcnI